MPKTEALEIKPFDLVIFGGTGDLALRKLFPSLYYHHCDHDLPEAGRIIAVARKALDTEGFLTMLNERGRPFVAPELFSEPYWQGFCERLNYLHIDVTRADQFQALAQMLGDYEDRERIYYLSTGPTLFAPICEHLARADLVTKQARIAVEKPLGHDLASAREINAQIGAMFEERQIYRIDHYLGKEPVQNLLALRFGNALFEPLWRRGHVSDVQITIAEQLGVGSRGEFYNQTGALRDMVQNHLLQLLCIIAMEPPTHNSPDAVRDEKLKVLRALRPLTRENALQKTVRGQYRAGAINGEAVPGYLEEPGVATDSMTETFVALQAEIDNWRWAGVPFNLRTGKRLQERVTEIVINFERLPHAIFDTTAEAQAPNQLVIRLQPEEYVRLSIRAKVPGDHMILRPVQLNLNLAESLQERQRSAYERLLVDLLRGRQTLFLRHDELEAAWSWVDPILAAWAASEQPLASYNAGTWGPTAASRLIYEQGRSWHEEH